MSTALPSHMTSRSAASGGRDRQPRNWTDPDGDNWQKRAACGLPRPRRRCGCGDLPRRAGARRGRRPATRCVATIDGTPITESDLGVAAQDFGDQLQRIPPEQAALGADRCAHRDPAGRQGGRSGRPRQEQGGCAEARLRPRPHAPQRIPEVEGRRQRHRRRGQEALRRGDRQVRPRRRSPCPSHSRARPRTRPRRSSPISTRAATSPRSPRRSRSIPVPGRRAAISASSVAARARRMLKAFEDAAFALDVGAYTKIPVQIPVRLARHQGRGEAQAAGRRPSRAQADRIRQQLARETVTNEIADAPRRRQDRDRARKHRRLTAAPAAPATPAPSRARRRRRNQAARCPTGAMSAVSPLAPKAYPELPPIAGVRFATAEAGIKYKNRTDVSSWSSTRAPRSPASSPGRNARRRRSTGARRHWRRARRGRCSSIRATPTPSPASAAARRSSCRPAWSPTRWAAGRRRSSSPRPA